MKSKETETIIFFMISFYVYSISMFLWDMTSNVRYIGIFIGIFQGIITLIRYNKFILNSKHKRLLLAIVLGIILFVLSKYVSYKNGVEMSFRVYPQILYTVIPAIYAYIIVNLLSFETFIKLMKVMLITNTILYITSVGIENFFSPTTWGNVLGKTSPFESAIYSGMFTVALFFFFYLTEIQNIKKDKIYLLLSIFLTIITWKRLSIAVAIALWIIGKHINLKKEISRCIPLGTAILFCPLTIIYLNFIQGKISIFGLDPYLFTTGRTYILSLWRKFGYISAGYGSSYELIHRYLEMDLIQIYMEVGVIALLCFSLYYFNLVDRSLFGYVIMLYEFLNMLTASSLPSFFEWILLSCFLMYINSSEEISYENKHYSSNI